MMTDGHSGLSNNVVKELGSAKFQGKLCYLKKDSGNYFVVHVHSGIITVSSHYQSADFLRDLGFVEYKNCTIMPGGCFYKEIYQVKNNFWSNDSGHMQETQFVHSEFESFMKNIDSVFDKTMEIKQKSHLFFRDYVAIKPISMKELEIKTPIWIDSYKSEEFNNGFGEIEKIKASLKEEITLLKLLTTNDDELVDAVKLAFEQIGFTVTKTKKGFTVDLIAEKDALKLGLEVTGTTNIISKQTKKINQILAFQQDESFNGYKALIIANVKMDEDPESRQEPFITTDALSLVENLNSGFIDTYTLFKAIKAIKNQEMTAEEVMSAVKDKKGIIKLSD